MSIYNIALYAALAAVCGLFAAGLYQFALILLKVPSSRTTKANKGGRRKEPPNRRRIQEHLQRHFAVRFTVYTAERIQEKGACGQP